MQVQDALRAQYYFRALENKLESIRPYFGGDLSPFFRKVCHSLDQILLPLVAFELGEAKEKGELEGETPEERYRSFFLQDGEFTERAKSLPGKYPQLFSQLDQTLEDAFSNLRIAITRFKQEAKLSPAKTVDLISHSEKHNGEQTLLFTCEDGSKWIYKPRDLRPDILLSEFVLHLNLPHPYDLKAPQILAREGYGFMGFLEHAPCKSRQDVHDYFRRAGVVLAIADSLNYTDGHFENLIASGPYPFLIDGETLFQNFDAKALKEKTILSTGLVQRTAPNEKKKAFHSAFQANQKEVYHILFPHALNERTDDLQVVFHGYREGIMHNLPHYEGSYFFAQNFMDEFIQGFEIGYNAITTHRDTILNDRNWWDRVFNLRALKLVRHTVNYIFLLRRIQQPDASESREKAAALITEKLGDSPYTSYEIRDLMKGNVPYFFHHPSERFFSNGDGERYPENLPETALDQIKRHLLSRNDNTRNEACELLKTHLLHAKRISQHEPSPAP